MNMDFFNWSTIITAVLTTVIFLVFRSLSKGKGLPGIVIYVAGVISLAVGIYAIGVMLVDMALAGYYKDVGMYIPVRAVTVGIVALGFAALVATVDKVAKGLRKPPTEIE